MAFAAAGPTTPKIIRRANISAFEYLTQLVYEFPWPSVYVDERAVMLPAPSLQRTKAKYLKGINYASVVRDRAWFSFIRVHARLFSSLRLSLFPCFHEKRNNLKRKNPGNCISFKRLHAPHTRPC